MTHRFTNLKVPSQALMAPITMLTQSDSLWHLRKASLVETHSMSQAPALVNTRCCLYLKLIKQIFLTILCKHLNKVLTSCALLVQIKQLVPLEIYKQLALHQLALSCFNSLQDNRGNNNLANSIFTRVQLRLRNQQKTMLMTWIDWAA